MEDSSGRASGWPFDRGIGNSGTGMAVSGERSRRVSSRGCGRSNS